MIWVNCAFALRQEIAQLIRAKLRDCSSLKEASGWRPIVAPARMDDYPY
jgi:hypothetical protein